MREKTYNNSQNRLLKVRFGVKPIFVDMADSTAVESCKNKHGNQDLFVSTWSLQAPDPSAQRNYDLRFHITTLDPETARVSALEAVYHIMDDFSITDECMEITFNGGGKVGNNAAGKDDGSSEETSDTAHIIGQATPLCDHGNADTGIGAGDNDNIDQNAGNTISTNVVNRHSPANSSSNPGGSNSSGKAKEETADAEIIISIPPVVFGGQPASLTPVLNYYLARQMTEDGINNLDIDVYQRDHFVRLPNSINTATGRFVIPLSMKELLYLDGKAIAELARKPKSESSLIMPRPVPEAVEWYAETLAEFENKHRRQDELRKLILKNGWEVLPCIRHLMRLCLYDHNRLEAYRIISQFFSWIKAGAGEIRHLIYNIDRRNPIKNYRKMNAIIAFAVENPWFVGCQHRLLQQFCPAGKCFMAELIEEYENPRLFEQA